MCVRERERGRGRVRGASSGRGSAPRPAPRGRLYCSRWRRHREAASRPLLALLLPMRGLRALPAAQRRLAAFGSRQPGGFLLRRRLRCPSGGPWAAARGVPCFFSGNVRCFRSVQPPRPHRLRRRPVTARRGERRTGEPLPSGPQGQPAVGGPCPWFTARDRQPAACKVSGLPSAARPYRRRHASGRSCFTALGPPSRRRGRKGSIGTAASAC